MLVNIRAGGDNHFQSLRSASPPAAAADQPRIDASRRSETETSLVRSRLTGEAAAKRRTSEGERPWPSKAGGKASPAASGSRTRKAAPRGRRGAIRDSAGSKRRKGRTSPRSPKAKAD